MPILYILVFLFSLQTAMAQKKIVTLDKEQALEAFHYLNAFRANPKKAMKELGLGFDQTKVSNSQLNWDESLAKVAEFRAMDMARRNYFEHTTPEGIGPNYYINKGGYTLNPDWLAKLSANNFESIAANHPTAVDGVKAFIIGTGSPGFMHRKHVLGMDDWNGSLLDIGIGFAKVPEGSAYKTYLCVIIAKHDWAKK